jgi:hypothetical protein
MRHGHGILGAYRGMTSNIELEAELAMTLPRITSQTDYEMTADVIKDFLPDWSGQDHVDLDYGNLQTFAARLLAAYRTRFVIHKRFC